MHPVIVAVHYRLPAERLAAWFAWNAEGVAAVGARAIIVSDQAHPAPPWAEVLIYPHPMKLFSLTRTANFGLRRAVDQGAGVIIKTDADCILTPAWLAYALENVRLGHGVCPRYWMIHTPEDRDKAEKHPCIIGSMALVAADWAQVHGYRETMEGYGVDDCDLRDRLLAAGVDVPLVDHPRLYHVAHKPGTPQGRQRSDQHGRGGINPFNPRNHSANKAKARVAWDCPAWGLG